MTLANPSSTPKNCLKSSIPRFLDSSIPSGWQFCEYDEGEYHLEPVSTGEPGFYGHWQLSDGDHVAEAAARQAFRDELLRTAAEAGLIDKALIQEALSRLPPGVSPVPPP